MPPVSKIAKLPPELRKWLDEALVQRAFGDINGITDELKELCLAGGVAFTIGKSAVGEHSLRVKRAQETIAATTRSMQLIATMSRDDADLRGEALNAKISTDMFEALLDAQQAADEEDPAKRIALLNKASLAAARLTTTSVRQRQHRHEVEERAKAAANAVAKIAKQGGMTADQVREIRAQILGVAKTAPTRAAAPPPAAPA